MVRSCVRSTPYCHKIVAALLFDILPSRKRRRDSQSSQTWVPASLATGLPGCHSGLLFPLPPQASVPASPAVQAESLAPTYWDKCTSNGGHCQIVWPGKQGFSKVALSSGKPLPRRKSMLCRLDAVAPKRHNMLFPIFEVVGGERKRLLRSPVVAQSTPCDSSF